MSDSPHNVMWKEMYYLPYKVCKKKGVFLIIQSFVEKSHNYHARLCKKYLIYRTQRSTNALLTESQALCFHES